MTDDKTDPNATRDLKRGAIFYKYPDEYFRYALEWCAYPHWTIEETANLLSGCVPHREMLMRGKKHAALDEDVLVMENKIRMALKKELTVVKSRKYFGKTYLVSEEVFSWAHRNNIMIPKLLHQAEHEIRHRYNTKGYTTPCIEATKWVVENFWENANLREPPTAGAIIQALLQEFPELSGAECDRVEQIARHPLTRPD